MNFGKPPQIHISHSIFEFTRQILNRGQITDTKITILHNCAIITLSSK